MLCLHIASLKVQKWRQGSHMDAKLISNIVHFKDRLTLIKVAAYL